MQNILLNKDLYRFVYEECIELPHSLLEYVEKSKMYKIHDNFVYSINDKKFRYPISNINNPDSLYRFKRNLILNSDIFTNFKFDYKHFLSFYMDYNLLS